MTKCIMPSLNVLSGDGTHLVSVSKPVDFKSENRVAVENADALVFLWKWVFLWKEE